MVTKIIGCADIHIPQYKGLEDLKCMLQKFINECKEFVNKEGNADNVRIVVGGDIFDKKTAITNESIMAVSWFLKELGSVCKTIVIIGNHDFLMNNMDRTDSLTPLFEIGNFDNVVYLDKEIGYKSGCLIDDNIVWCLYSSFSGFDTPNITEVKRLNPNKDYTYVGLIHGDVKGAKNDLSYESANGLDANIFNDCDFVIAGHIHKRQEIVSSNGVKIVYCSSITQKNFGETISNHGYIIWNVADKTYEFKDLINEEGGYFKFSIESIDDIENDKEVLLNY